MPPALLAALRRALVALLVVGALLGAVPAEAAGAPAAEHGSLSSVVSSAAPAPLGEEQPDATAAAPLPPRGAARANRPA
ncbi:hypothetical protein ACFWXK_21795, partial [Streptomyces sp. NPDC059070]